jgi:hypothetical protein
MIGVGMDNAIAIQCEVTGKLLARRDAKGIYLWCKVCKTEHFIPWIPEGQKSDKLASEADLCYNLSR